jgi:sigma-B regulation protein RsbU (phosphoserine phosphatase)
MVKSKNRSRSLAYATLVVLFVFSSIQWVRTCRDSIDYILHGEQIVRPPFGLNEITGEVNGRSPEAKAVGLENGDILLAVNGHPYEGLADYWGAFRSAKLGDSIRVRVRSTTPTGAVDKDLSIELPPFTYMGLTKVGSRAFLWIILPSILLPFFCLVLGFWVATVRIGDKSAWLLLFMLLGFAYIITESRTLYGN